MTPHGERMGEEMNAREERELFAANLDRHVEAEGRILEEYRALSEKIQHGPVGLLIDLILTEEEQHHFLLRTMAKTLRRPLQGEGGLGGGGVDRGELLGVTRRFREHEQETISACRTLKTQIPVEEAELFDALLDVLILDSEKHQRLLLAVERIITAAPGL